MTIESLDKVYELSLLAESLLAKRPCIHCGSVDFKKVGDGLAMSILCLKCGKIPWATETDQY